MMPSRPEDKAGALDGILVADFSRVLAGPYATMLLADMGADVVKVERPGVGDESRAWGPPFVGEESTYFLAVNRNKRSLALDLSDAQDLELAVELCRRADVVIENFRPGTMERLGLGYTRLREENPRLVYCAISGFGRGAGAHLTGYDFLLQAVGGLMSITGDPDGEPMKVGVALVDVVTGLFAAVGILAALRAREQTGAGQRVDLNLLSSLLAVLVNQAAGYLNTGTVPQRSGNRHPSVAPYELFEAEDGPLVLAVGNPRQFEALVQLVGLPELANDPRFATNAGRIQHRDALRNALGPVLRSRTIDEWTTRLHAAGVPAGKVNSLAEAFSLAEDLGLGPSFAMSSGDGDRPGARQVSNPLEMSDTPVRYTREPPKLGEHGVDLRRSLGSRQARSPEPPLSG